MLITLITVGTNAVTKKLTTKVFVFVLPTY